MEAGEKGMQGSCAVHPSKAATSYCVQHELSICITCLLTHHKHCIDHVQAIENNSPSPNSTAGEIERICDRLTTNVSDMKHRKKAWVGNLDKVEKELIAGLQHMGQRIVQKVDKLCTEAMDMSKSVLKEHRKMYEADIEILHEYHIRLKELKQNLYYVKSSDELLTIERQLEQMKDDFQRRNLKSGDVKVHFHVSEVVSRLEHNLDTFGELCVEDVTERVRSLYLSPSEIQRLSTEILGRQWGTGAATANVHNEHALFLVKDTEDTGGMYGRIPNDEPPLGEVRQSNPPPLPTMENRLMSPRIATVNLAWHRREQQEPDSVFNGANNDANETSDFLGETENSPADTQIERNEDENKRGYQLNLYIPSLPSKLRQDVVGKIGKDTKASVLSSAPNKSKEVPINEKMKYDETPTVSRTGKTCLEMPKLPTKRSSSKNRSLSPSSRQTYKRFNDSGEEAGSADAKRSSNTKESSQKPHKQLTNKHNPTSNVDATRDSQERPDSNFKNFSDGCRSTGSGRDSGLGQELPSSSKTNPESSLKIPALPSMKERKLSDPSPCMRRGGKDNNYDDIDDIDPIHPSSMKSFSDTDLVFNDAGNVTNIRAKEVTLNTEVKPNDDITSTGAEIGKNITKTKRLVKSEGCPAISKDDLNILYSEIILDATSANTSKQTKARNATFITSLTVLDGGKILVCDFQNNSAELFDSYGVLKDVFILSKPFGCCPTGDNRFSVTSKEPPRICIFEIENAKMKLVAERHLDAAVDVFGVSYSHGFYCLSCLSEVKLLPDQTVEREIQIRPLERHGKPRKSWINKGKPPKTFFTDVQYALMERLEERFYVFTSDIKKRRVTSVGVNGMVVWTQPNMDCRALAFYTQQVIVATDRQVVLLNAGTGDFVRVIGAGIPRHPWSLAVDKDLFPCLLVSDSDKTGSRKIARVPLEQINVNTLSDVHYV